MNALLQEYGDTLVSCIIGVILLVFIFFVTENYYDGIYPQYNDKSIVNMYHETMASSEPPILIVNKEIKIRRNDTRYDAMNCVKTHTRDSAEYQEIVNNYKALATAYESDSNQTEIDVDVLRIETVDVTKIGKVFNLIYKATNTNGHTTTKQVYVLIN